MKMTSNEAAKLLRKMNDELQMLRNKENKSSTFNACVGEDIEEVRPNYDYADTQEKIRECEKRIISLKHQINVFNVNTVVPDTDGMTIDQVLILFPMLTAEENKLAMMSNRLPKERQNVQFGRTSSVIDYSYANYSIEEAEKDYIAVTARLAAIQNALDVVNNTVQFDVDI